ncbi:MAG: RluA family pseudouridine synthase [Firmicutes bacterium]|nr:RluA family pseudouridine synthase [Bacillota bacterium]
MKSFKVSEKSKLFDAIISAGIKLSYNGFCKLLRNKDIKVNSVRVTENLSVLPFDVVEVYLKEKDLTEFKPDIIFEDENVVLVNKPVKILTVGENSLHIDLESFYAQKVFPCHRLDFNTSGIVVFAKNEIAYNEILQGFKNNLIEKFYFCLAYGVFDKCEETLDAYLFKDSIKSKVYIYDVFSPGCQKITTKYNVLKQFENYAALEVQLVTGRTHQIRAHLNHIGHPIIGDSKYGKNFINKKFKQKFQNLVCYKLIFNFEGNYTLKYLNNSEFKIRV